MRCIKRIRSPALVRPLLGPAAIAIAVLLGSASQAASAAPPSFRITLLLDPVDANRSSGAEDINDAGLVVGSSHSGAATLWGADATAQILGIAGDARAINGAGAVVGMYQRGRFSNAYFWSPSGGLKASATCRVARISARPGMSTRPASWSAMARRQAGSKRSPGPRSTACGAWDGCLPPSNRTPTGSMMPARWSAPAEVRGGRTLFSGARPVACRTWAC